MPKESFPVNKVINKKQIQNNLLQLDSYYRKASSSKNPSDNRKVLYYAKLAIIELCGWTEESMDDIVLTCAKRCLTDTKNITDIEEVVSRTWGFDYSSDFRNMLIQVMGIVNVERLERNIDQIQLQRMRTEFGHLKPDRNVHSHTHLKRMPRIDSTAVTIGRFRNIYVCLKDFERCVRKMSL